MVHPPQVMSIKPLNHRLALVVPHITLRQHERYGQQDRQADYKADHRLSHGSLLA
jgi:hypothetical protein